MDLNKIKELIDLLKDTDITEISIQNEELKIKIKRGYNTQKQEKQQIKTEQIKTEEETKEEQNDKSIVIKSPIVGTFYRSQTPDEGPLIKEGDKVRKGQVLCIIEAMKLMNEIESEYEGIVKEIIVENGNPVEYGEPLLILEQL
ncbi:Acetyl-CoA biotin carboxyl carrier [Candidatus Magnetoovum chiemensis]|nr:Acetyl-CoA biotin carboxyl carrier [Candidatus Magnetoovum chiemensis]